MTPLILALDTTHEFGSLALLRGEQLLEEETLHAPDGFAHVLYRHLGGLLMRHGLEVEQIDCFAAASGPGSFTGVRVGLACIKGLAEAEGKPAVAVSNLRAMAEFAAAPLRAVVMDARRGEVYGAVYDAGGTLVLPETVGPLAQWLERLPQGDVQIVTSDLELPAPAMRAPQAIAAAVARLALRDYLDGKACDPAALDANYVRRSDAELFWRE